MNYRDITPEIREEICQFIDGELDEITQTKVLVYLASSDEYQNFYIQQKVFKNNLAQKVNRKSCGDSFKENILLKIRGL